MEHPSVVPVAIGVSMYAFMERSSSHIVIVQNARSLSLRSAREIHPWCPVTGRCCARHDA